MPIQGPDWSNIAYVVTSLAHAILGTIVYENFEPPLPVGKLQILKGRFSNLLMYHKFRNYPQLYT